MRCGQGVGAAHDSVRLPRRWKSTMAARWRRSGKMSSRSRLLYASATFEATSSPAGVSTPTPTSRARLLRRCQGYHNTLAVAGCHHSCTLVAVIIITDWRGIDLAEDRAHRIRQIG